MLCQPDYEIGMLQGFTPICTSNPVYIAIGNNNSEVMEMCHTDPTYGVFLRFRNQQSFANLHNARKLSETATRSGKFPPSTMRLMQPIVRAENM